MSLLRDSVLPLARLALVMGALVAVSSEPSSATEEFGSCNEATPGWACARADDWKPNRYCDAGQSGGCETCEHTGNSNDSCFYGGGGGHTGWKVGTYNP